MEQTAVALQKIKEQLHVANYKLTPQREAILLVLLENEKDHLSAEEIYMLVKLQNFDIGLATVYRTLEMLTELRILDKVNFNDGMARYDMRKDGAKHFHHHLLCVECGGIDEIEEDLLMEAETIVERDYAFKIMDHRLTFHGICHTCQMRHS
ncbi:ferric iron uptake transcriptional regulator [Vagococcus jeotgali]|uniref:ferric iron uptake transcriptional regulator n=1 Tax=Vagococcus jeotgali TaxID=3109030 RepID=UPI002DD830F2|nr:Fur family transcriptional regulator [Vagococcus sp. B2T-5]